MATKAKKAAAKETKSSKKSIDIPKSEMTEAQLAAMASEAGDEEAEEEEMGSSSGGSSGNAAALAAATSSSESTSFKNFRHHPDMENFYRFIYENDLRLEALAIIDEMMVQKQALKMTKQAKKSAH